MIGDSWVGEDTSFEQTLRDMCGARMSDTGTTYHGGLWKLFYAPDSHTS